MNFPESSLANLGSLGYTEDEARFLWRMEKYPECVATRQRKRASSSV